MHFRTLLVLWSWLLSTACSSVSGPRPDLDVSGEQPGLTDRADGVAETRQDQVDPADRLTGPPEMLSDLPVDAGDLHGPETDLQDLLVDEVGPDLPDGSADGADGGSPEPWRSALYPEEWIPSWTHADGHFLHDFSYAGYHNSEVPLPVVVVGTVVSILDTGADPSGSTDATAAIQAALDTVTEAGGGVVLVPTGLYRCDGLLSASCSNLVIRGEGAENSRIYFTRHAGMTGKAHLALGKTPSAGPDLPLAADVESRESILPVEDASTLSVGDDISVGWVITPEFIDEHGMTGVWQAFNDTWQPFFRREVSALDLTVTPHLVTIDVPLRYPVRVAHGASIRREEGWSAEVGLEDLGVANAVGWQEAWANERAQAVSMSGIKDGWVRGVRSFVSPLSPESGPGAGAHLQNGGLKLHACKRMTVADCDFSYAQNRGEGGCGYLYEIRVSSEVLTRDCSARAGRHNFIQNWGFGTTGCVWLRCHSVDGLALVTPEWPDIGAIGFSEFHHSLATANLIDTSQLDDGFKAVNRGDYSTGAGHSATQNVFWGNLGNGQVVSRQFGWGYVIGTGPDLTVHTGLEGGWFWDEAQGTEPEDWVEGEGAAEWLEPTSLFEDQLARRLETL